MKKLLLSALVVSLLGACASTAEPEKKPAVEDRTSQSQTTGTTKPADSKPIDQSGVNGSGLAPHLDPANKLSSDRSVYFDYDQYAIRADARPILDSQAAWLNRYRSVRLMAPWSTSFSHCCRPRVAAARSSVSLPAASFSSRPWLQ